VIEAPRQSVFIGTVNNASYLRDETGGRRFWPIQCGEINLEALRRDRDQLWAEAQARFTAGESWWITDAGVAEQARAEQADRYEGDPWASIIEDWATGRDSITVEQVLALCIEKPKAQWQQLDMNRAARCLRAAGWGRFQQRAGDRREWRYRRTSPKSPESPVQRPIVTG
jgi:predicted P-loop ATPase